MFGFGLDFKFCVEQVHEGVYSTLREVPCRVNALFVRFVHVFGPKSTRYSTHQPKSGVLPISWTDVNQLSTSEEYFFACR